MDLINGLANGLFDILLRPLEGLGARAQLDLFAGEMHAFHAFVWRDAARRCWRNQFAFLDRVLAAPAG